MPQEPRRQEDTEPEYDEEGRAEHHSECHRDGPYGSIEETTTFLEMSSTDVHGREAGFDIFFVVGKLGFEVFFITR